jgi:hypothetical protein
MSYCRWSSDNWKSDIYCYESSYGFVTAVASNKRILDGMPLMPLNPVLVDCTEEEREELWKDWFRIHEEQMEFLETAEMKKIGLKYDGETFDDSTAEECLETLLMLQKEGYHVPEDAIEALREEVENPEVQVED